MNRRQIMTASTALAGTTALAGLSLPCSVETAIAAQGDLVSVPLASLNDTRSAKVQWLKRPILVSKRNANELRSLQESALLEKLRDPDSSRRQQPPYAQNWHRSIDPMYVVLVGVCTYCACVPVYQSDDVVGMVGGYVCPCCASRYDPAGRSYSGPGTFNLPVPPYVQEVATIQIGRNPKGYRYTLSEVERL